MRTLSSERPSDVTTVLGLPPPLLFAEQDLLDIEPDSKWPLLTMVRLKEMQLQLLTAGSPAAAAAVAGSSAAQAAELAEEVRSIYATLRQVDPLRAGYYQDAVEGRASVVMAPAATQPVE